MQRGLYKVNDEIGIRKVQLPAGEAPPVYDEYPFTFRLENLKMLINSSRRSRLFTSLWSVSGIEKSA